MQGTCVFDAYVGKQFNLLITLVLRDVIKSVINNLHNTVILSVIINSLHDIVGIFL